MNSHPFRPLRHRDVRRVWLAGCVSDIGTWVQLIVVGSLVARGTGSAVQTGLIALATFAPQGAASPVGGLLADRFDRRKVFVRALFVQALMTAILAAMLAFGVRNSVALSALVMLGSAAGAVGQPSFSSMLPDLVPPDELMAMVALGVYSWNAGRIIGPLLGALLAALVGPAPTIAFNALTFAALAGSIWFLRRDFMPQGDGGGTIAERLAEGVQSVRTIPGCRHGFAIILLLNIAVAAFMGLIPIYSALILDGGARIAGMLSAAQGVGAIAGSFALTYLAGRAGRARLLPGVLGVLLAGYLVYAWAPSLWVSMVGVFFLGAGTSSLFVTGFSIVQRDAPPERRGRVMAITSATMGVSYGVGILTIGLIADLVNLRVAFTCSAVAAAALYSLAARRSPDWRRAIDGEPVAAELDRADLPVLASA